MVSPVEMELKAPGRMSVPFVRGLGDNNVFTIKDWVEEHTFQTMDGPDSCEALFFEETKKHVEIKPFRRKQLVALFGDQSCFGKKIRVVVNDKGWISFEAA